MESIACTLDTTAPSFFSCTAECANAYRQAGCCFNGDNQNQYWLNHCNISMPERCPPSKIQIPNISQQISCSSANDYSKQILQATCDNIDLVLNGFNREERCNQFSNNYRVYCSSKDSQYCINHLNFNPPYAGIRALDKAEHNCSSSSSGCSEQCKDALSQVESTVGCCIHALNVRDSRIPLSITNSWEKCEIPVPPKCGGNSITLSSVSSKANWGCYGSLVIVSSFVITHAII